MAADGLADAIEQAWIREKPTGRSAHADVAARVVAVRGPEPKVEADRRIADLEADLERAQEDRDRWIRLFNRMDAAISHHRKKAFVDDEDEALHAAHDRVLKASCLTLAEARERGET